MAGHSKWANIKHRKGAVDAKRSKLFSKHAKLIAIAAKTDPNPETNATLRSAIDRARKDNVPKDNIDRAISKARDAGDLEHVRYEAYGPEGVAMIINAITDNTNRTIAEVRKILSDHDAKMAEQGSVLWSFEEQNGQWKAKFPQNASKTAKDQVQKLTEALEDNDDVESIITNVSQ